MMLSVEAVPIETETDEHWKVFRVGEIPTVCVRNNAHHITVIPFIEVSQAEVSKLYPAYTHYGVLLQQTSAAGQPRASQATSRDEEEEEEEQEQK